MAEQYDVTTPVAQPPLASYQVIDIDLHYAPPASSNYAALIREKTTPTKTILYRVVDREAGAYGPGTVANLATARIKAFNTMNFSTQSMQRRFLQNAASDIDPETKTQANPNGTTFLPPGTVTGTPDP